MAELTDAQRKRAEARQRRRGQAESGSADGGGGEAPAESQGSDEQPLDAVKHAAKVAAAGAAVGAAAAAARALTSNRGDDGAEVPEAEEEAPSHDEQASSETEEPAPPEEPGEDDAERREPEPEPVGAPERERDPEPQREPVEGAAPGDAKATIDRAREQLEELLERAVESVSSLERTHDGWVVALEVVEFQRVPESMDVLASYEMELDEDRNLRRYQKVRRYHRAEADREEGP